MKLNNMVIFNEEKYLNFLEYLNSNYSLTYYPNSSDGGFVKYYKSAEFDLNKLEKQCKTAITLGAYLHLISSLLYLPLFDNSSLNAQRIYIKLKQIEIKNGVNLKELLDSCVRNCEDKGKCSVNVIIEAIKQVVCKTVLGLENVPEQYTEDFINQLKSACYNTNSIAPAGLMSSVLLAYDYASDEEKANNAFCYGANLMLGQGYEEKLIVNELCACVDFALSKLLQFKYCDLNKIKLLQLWGKDTNEDDANDNGFAILTCVTRTDASKVKASLARIMSLEYVVDFLQNNISSICDGLDEYEQQYSGISDRLIIYSAIFNFLRRDYKSAEKILETYYETIEYKHRVSPVVIFLVLELLKRADSISAVESLKRMLNFEARNRIIRSSFARMQECLLAIKLSLQAFDGRSTVISSYDSGFSNENPLTSEVSNAFGAICESVASELENDTISFEAFKALYDIIKCSITDSHTIRLDELRQVIALPKEFSGVNVLKTLQSLLEYCECDEQALFEEAELAYSCFDLDEDFISNAKLLISTSSKLRALELEKARLDYDRIRKNISLYANGDNSHETIDWIYNLIEKRAEEYLEKCKEYFPKYMHIEAKDSVEKSMNEFCKKYGIDSQDIIKNRSQEIYDYLITSEMVYNYLIEQEALMDEQDKADLDYSAALISLVKALETILKEKMFEPMLNRVKKELDDLKEGETSKLIPPCFKIQEKKSKNNNSSKNKNSSDGFQTFSSPLPKLKYGTAMLNDFCSLLLPVARWDSVKKNNGFLSGDNTEHFKDFGGNDIFNIEMLTSFKGLKPDVLYSDKKGISAEFKGYDDSGKSKEDINRHNQIVLAGALNYVRIKYRNPVAHTEKISKETMKNGRISCIAYDVKQQSGALIWILLSILK